MLRFQPSLYSTGYQGDYGVFPLIPMIASALPQVVGMLGKGKKKREEEAAAAAAQQAAFFQAEMARQRRNMLLFGGGALVLGTFAVIVWRKRR